jgi:preprotein translocase subunit SecA
MNKQREVMYAERMKVIKQPDVHQDILNLIPDFVKEVVSSVIDNGNKPETWNLEDLNRAIEAKLLPGNAEFVTKERAENWDYEYLIEKLIKETIAQYEAKIERYKEQGLDFKEVEKVVLLRNIDSKWIDHIDAMDQLKKGISLRGYGNVDPVLEYKKEGFEMFEDLTWSIQDDTCTLLIRAELRKIPEMTKEEKRDFVTNEDNGGAPRARVINKEPGRNDMCPCGSGKKYKNCCGNK